MQTVLGGLLHIAGQYAELARRTRPGTHDFVEACTNQGITLGGLSKVIADNKAHRGQFVPLLTFTNGSDRSPDNVPQLSQSKELELAIRDPTVKFLPDAPEDVKRRADCAPEHFPTLPPSHSYKQTPVYPSLATPEQAAIAGMPLLNPFGPERQAGGAAVETEQTSADVRISQLDSRIRTTRLVEASLQSLIRATTKGKAVQQAAAQDEVNAEEGAVVQTSKEDMAILLERYERDAAICNFEVEWYGKGGKQAALADVTAQTTAQIAGQRKRGRWKV